MVEEVKRNLIELNDKFLQYGTEPDIEYEFYDTSSIITIETL